VTLTLTFSTQSASYKNVSSWLVLHNKFLSYINFLCSLSLPLHYFLPPRTYSWYCFLRREAYPSSLGTRLGVTGTPLVLRPNLRHFVDSIPNSMRSKSCTNQSNRLQMKWLPVAMSYASHIPRHTVLASNLAAPLFVSTHRFVKNKEKVQLSRNRPWRPIGLWDVKDPTLSRQSAHS
jgi:hypothetical protein